jgi:hypothetical protein
MNLTSLRLDTRYLVFGDNSNTSYSNTDLDRNLNRAYYQLLQLAMQYCGKWQVNKTYAVDNILAGITKYAFPGDILRIERVEIKPLVSLINPYLAVPIDLSEVNGDLDEFTPSTPHYDLRKNYIQFFFNQAFENVTSGLKIYLQNDIVELLNASDEPSKPQFPEFTHDYLTNRAAHKYCLANEMWNKVTALNNDLKEMIIPMIKEHYANRTENEPTIIKPLELNLY